MSPAQSAVAAETLAERHGQDAPVAVVAAHARGYDFAAIVTAGAERRLDARGVISDESDRLEPSNPSRPVQVPDGINDGTAAPERLGGFVITTVAQGADDLDALGLDDAAREELRRPSGRELTEEQLRERREVLADFEQEEAELEARLQDDTLSERDRDEARESLRFIREDINEIAVEIDDLELQLDDEQQRSQPGEAAALIILGLLGEGYSMDQVIEAIVFGTWTVELGSMEYSMCMLGDTNFALPANDVRVGVRYRIEGEEPAGAPRFQCLEGDEQESEADSNDEKADGDPDDAEPSSAEGAAGIYTGTAKVTAYFPSDILDLPTDTCVVDVEVTLTLVPDKTVRLEAGPYETPGPSGCRPTSLGLTMRGTWTEGGVVNLAGEGQEGGGTIAEDLVSGRGVLPDRGGGPSSVTVEFSAERG